MKIRMIHLWFALPLLLVTLISLLMALDYGMIRLPFAPFETEGAIYVDSPEIYTRERLVNDRYEHDYWLRKQLKNLDSAENFTTGSTYKRYAVDVTAPGAGTDSTGGTGGDPVHSAINESGQITPMKRGEGKSLTFPQEFRIRAAVRDSIRQLILENMLDDRHDLKGSSLFGLKFDTTVIPGTNTHKRAFINISLTPDSLESDSIRDPKKKQIKGLPAHVKQSLLADDTSDKNNSSNDLEKYENLYHKWLNDLEFRLNLYVTNYCKYISAGKNMGIGAGKKTEMLNTQGISAITVMDVLGMNLNKYLNKSKIYEPKSTDINSEDDAKKDKEFEKKTTLQRINLSMPWSNLLQITTSRLSKAEDDACKNDLTFNVEIVYDTIYIIKLSDWEYLQKMKEPESELLPYFVLDTKEMANKKDNDKKKEYVIAVSNPYKNYTLTKKQFEEIKPKYPQDNRLGKLVEIALKNGKTLPILQITLPKDACSESRQPLEKDGCKAEIETLGIPSGLFNFIDSVLNTDAYTYAIFPKTDIVGILSETSFSGNVNQGSLARNGGIRAQIGIETGVRESKTPAVLIGYGDGLKSDGRTVRFGWVISGRNVMESVQKSQMVLISVPSWTRSLKLEITTGWLDRNSQQTSDDPKMITVPVPPDLEAVDSVMVENNAKRQPKILDLFLDDVQVRACTRADIIIPGLRLWRSTTVTLGSQRADRIVVLPNMHGIIATFNTVQIPNVAPDSDTKNAKTKLRVWTSQGISFAKKPVTVTHIPESGFCEKK